MRRRGHALEELVRAAAIDIEPLGLVVLMVDRLQPRGREHGALRALDGALDGDGQVGERDRRAAARRDLGDAVAAHAAAARAVVPRP